MRLKWTEWQIEAAKQGMQDNNGGAQELLSIEIAGLKSMVESMEDSSVFRLAKKNNKADLKQPGESKTPPKRSKEHEGNSIG